MIETTNDTIHQTVDSLQANGFERINGLNGKGQMTFISKSYELYINLVNKEFAVFDKLIKQYIL